MSAEGKRAVPTYKNTERHHRPPTNATKGDETMTKRWASQIRTGLTSGNGVALDGSGYAYVVGYGDSRVFKVNLKDGSNGGGPFASVGRSRGVAVGLDGYVYVLSYNGQSLHRVSPKGVVDSDPVATGLAGVHDVALDDKGNAYVVNNAGDLWRIPLGGEPKEKVVSGLGDVWGVALGRDGTDGRETYAYVTNAVNGNLYKVGLSDGQHETLTTTLQKPTNLALDADGNAYITESTAGALVGVSTDGTQPDAPAFPVADGLPNPQAVAIDGNRSAWVLSGDGTLYEIAEAAKSAPIGAPTIAAPLPDAQAGPYIKFKGAAPLDSAPPHTTTATAIIAQKPDGTNIGSQIVAKDGYWAWALGEDALHVATPEASHAPASDRGLPWDPGQHTIQFVTHNNLGYSAPTPITFTTPQT
ncbi:Vgb family protein [Streptomyces sp. BA2]|uniref:Vgb family protein n=1 Tax=Streptomyces sp. BA2 TaxID=436595 RepID=UPI00136D1EED|nr:SBBP repeat-containing protein [Streptomyces sp. BA2]